MSVQSLAYISASVFLSHNKQYDTISKIETNDETYKDKYVFFSLAAKDMLKEVLTDKLWQCKISESSSVKKFEYKAKTGTLIKKITIDITSERKIDLYISTRDKTTYLKILKTAQSVLPPTGPSFVSEYIQTYTPLELPLYTYDKIKSMSEDEEDKFNEQFLNNSLIYLNNFILDDSENLSRKLTTPLNILMKADPRVEGVIRHLKRME